MSPTVADIFRCYEHGVLALAGKTSRGGVRGDERNVKIKEARMDTSIANLILHGNRKKDDQTLLTEPMESTFSWPFYY